MPPTISKPEGFGLSTDQKGNGEQFESSKLHRRQDGGTAGVRKSVDQNTIEYPRPGVMNNGVGDQISRLDSNNLGSHIEPLDIHFNRTPGLLDGEIEWEPLRILLDTGSGITYISEGLVVELFEKFSSVELIRLILGQKHTITTQWVHHTLMMNAAGGVVHFEVPHVVLPSEQRLMLSRAEDFERAVFSGNLGRSSEMGDGALWKRHNIQG